MLNALKSIYTMTSCILSVSGKFSELFNTSCGIRQGAPSSSCLFIVFINDLIDFVRSRCVCEPLIGCMHVLLHADDTLILSTSRHLFIKKCNMMIEYFTENKLNLNLGKSGYLIINGKIADVKEALYLDNRLLEYKESIVYLGLLFSDTGSISNDIKLNVQNKRNNISIKFTNFCAKNYLAPINVKLSVLHSCVMSSLCYGSETWGNNSCDEVDVIYRMGLRTALSVRQSTCNEIIFLETGSYPISCQVKKRQFKFWKTLHQNLENDSPLKELIEKAKILKLPYILYYENLVQSFNSAK